MTGGKSEHAPPGIRYPRIPCGDDNRTTGYICPGLVIRDPVSGIEALQRLDLRRVTKSDADLAMLKRMGELATLLIDLDDRAWVLREGLRARYAELNGRKYKHKPMPERYPEKGGEQEFDVGALLRGAVEEM